jgi:hypothetical protein
MSSTSSGYRELGLELVSLEESFSRLPRKYPMAEEKRDDMVRDSFKLFLEESLV